MNHNNKHQEQSSTIDGNDKVYQNKYGNFDLNTTDIFNDLDSDDHDDDVIKQDYDLDNLYVRERREEIEEQTDTMSEDDDNEIESIDTQDKVLVDRVKISRTSNKTQSIEEEHGLSQKFSQLSASAKSQKKKQLNKNMMAQSADYLAKNDKSFENMLNSVLVTTATTTVTLNRLEDFRQMATFIHYIKYNEILYSLWTVYLKSGLGELKAAQHPRNPLNPQVWPMPVKSMVKTNIRSGIKEHDACLAYVKDRLVELEKDIKQSQSNLHDQINRLPTNSFSIIRQAIETFIDEKLIKLRKTIKHKIQLVHYDYDERILELQYLQNNPTEAQIQLANQRCVARQQHETTKHELQLLEKQIAHHHSSSASFDTLPISHVPLFDSINNANVQQQLYAQYKHVIEQSKMDMFNLYISTATTQMQHYQRQHNDQINKIWQDQRSLPQDQKLTPIMMDLIEQRANINAERIECIYNFKTQTLSIH